VIKPLKATVAPLKVLWPHQFQYWPDCCMWRRPRQQQRR